MENEKNPKQDDFDRFVEFVSQVTRDGLATDHPDVVSAYAGLKKALKEIEKASTNTHNKALS